MSDRDALVASRYRLVERIATGGMGVVWRGWDERLRRVVAIKELLVHPGLGEAAAEQAAHRAMREARITARLQHPHAIPVYDVVEHDGRPCLIMEYVPSRSLQNVLTERTTLGVDEVATIGSQIAAALSAAHRAGIVHRDVKPGNMLLAEDGTAKLTDFGISRAFGDVTVTTTGMVTGTPAYLAPEVASGTPAGFPADVFSLGSTLYTALEGHPPFGTQGNPIAILHRVASGHVIPPRRCGRLTPVINDMLQHNPASRPTMRQVEQALSIAAAGGVAPAASHLLVSPSQQTQQLTLSANPPAKPMPPPATPPGIAHRRRRGHPAGPERCPFRTRHHHQRRRQDHRKLVDNGTALDCEVRDATRRHHDVPRSAGRGRRSSSFCRCYGARDPRARWGLAVCFDIRGCGAALHRRRRDQQLLLARTERSVGCLGQADGQLPGNFRRHR